jgi:hypothetical protein
MADSRIINEYIHTSIGLSGGQYHGTDLAGNADIGLRGQRLVTSCHDLLNYLLGSLSVPICYHHSRAFSCKTPS